MRPKPGARMLAYYTPPFCPLYCLTADYDGMDAELKRRGIRASYLQTSERWRLYKIPGDQVQKLPADIGDEDRYYSSMFYFGDEKSGHSIYPMFKEDCEEYRTKSTPPKWIDV